VLECKKTLLSLTRMTKVRLGFQDTPVLTETRRRTGSVRSAIVDRIFRQRSDIAWKEAGGMRQSRCLNGLLSKKQVEVMELPRKDLRCVTGLLTGHCHENNTFWVYHRIRNVACVWKTRKLRYTFSHSARHLRRFEKSFGVRV